MFEGCGHVHGDERRQRVGEHAMQRPDRLGQHTVRRHEVRQGQHAEPGDGHAVDPTHTFARYAIPHFDTPTNRGLVGKTGGSVVLDKAARTGKAGITLDMSFVATGVAGLDAHLEGPDFFDVARFPSAR